MFTVAKMTEAYYQLEIHMCSDLDVDVIARNFLLSHIMLSDDFDPANPDDMDHLWNVGIHLPGMRQQGLALSKMSNDYYSGFL